MIPVNYDHWFSLEFWTFEQAAYLFNNIDPNDEDHIACLNDRTNAMMVGKGFKPLMHFNKSLQLLKGSDFPEDRAHHIPAGSVALPTIFKLAKEKDIGTHASRLVKEWESRSKHSTPAPEQIPASAKMLKTLQPTIALINDFAKSTCFLRHGEKTPQNLITGWLEEKELSGHQKRHVKELITSFYGIETSRRK